VHRAGPFGKSPARGRDLYAELLDFLGHGLRQSLDRELGSTIGTAMLKTDDAGERADVDDPARTLLAHDGKHRAHDVDHAVEIGRNQSVDFGRGQLFEVAKQTVARIVQENVDAAEGFYGLGGGCFRLGFIGDIQLHEGEVLARGGAEDLLYLLDIAASRDDLVASRQRCSCSCRADAAACTCDEPNFTHLRLLHSIGEDSSPCETGLDGLICMSLEMAFMNGSPSNRR
jgi:hypothetical protein